LTQRFLQTAPAQRGLREDDIELIQINRRRYPRRVHVDSRTELVIAADIAERLGISRQRVKVLADRSGFPRPIGKLGRSSVALGDYRTVGSRDGSAAPRRRPPALNQ
jgi:predicted DNA-binding transcriptional regulator AlpA